MALKLKRPYIGFKVKRPYVDMYQIFDQIMLSNFRPEKLFFSNVFSPPKNHVNTSL